MKIDCAHPLDGVRDDAADAEPSSGEREDFASVEEILSEVRAGRPVVIVDAADRENEGDLIVAAQFADHHLINFMARHARGLICLALTQERAHDLCLPPMTR